MAKRFYSKHTLNIFTLKLERWNFPSHKHNFYELILIKEGTGSHLLNGVKFSYQARDIFLLSHDDEHSFIIDEVTTFEFIKFTEQIFSEKRKQLVKNSWQSIIQNVLYSPNILPGDIIHHTNDRSKIFQLHALLQQEYNEKVMYSRQFIMEIFGGMMLIIARNIHLKGNPKKELLLSEEEKVSEMLSYIRQHIYEKEKVSLKVIAEKFYLSENYVSVFIKKHMGMSIKQLVIETRLESAERMLKHSSYTISEIASKLGFTDTPHFSNTFKKHKGVSPSVFQK